MFPIPEQFSTAAKAQLEAQLKILNTLTGQAFKGAEQLIALNIHTGKAALENSAASAKQMLALKDPTELFKFGSSQAQPSLEHLLAYGRQLFGIASGAQTELMRAARTEQSATTVTPAPAAKPVVAPESKAAPLAKPAAVAAKPEVVATKPTVVIATPAIVAAKPAVVAAKPAVVAAKPAAIVAKPAVVADKPAAIVAKPAVVAAKPAVVVAKPAVVAAKPAVVAKAPAPAPFPASKTLVVARAPGATVPALKAGKPVVAAKPAPHPGPGKSGAKK